MGRGGCFFGFLSGIAVRISRWDLFIQVKGKQRKRRKQNERDRYSRSAPNDAGDLETGLRWAMREHAAMVRGILRRILPGRERDVEECMADGGMREAGTGGG